METKYLNEYHKKRSEACQKAVEEMSKHPLSYEQKMQQIKALNKASKSSKRLKIKELFIGKSNK